MSMMGEMTFFLGLQVNQSSRGIFINQSIYVLEILKKYEMESCDPVGTPMEIRDKLDLDQNGNPVDGTKYRSMIGALMYLTSSRPDIVHATCLCARYQAKPTEKHLKEVKRIFRYLRGTVNTGLWYTKDSGFELTGFSDVDHARCKDTFKSTFGGAQFLGEKLLTDYGFNFNKIPIYCDSKSAIAISCNPVQHSRTKHIAVRYHFIKEHVEKGTIELYFVKTDYQLADIFTKALPVDLFNYLVCRLGNMSYLSDFEELNGDMLPLEVTQRVLPDESQVLLRVPRKNNMYNVNLKNIVPFRDFNCLFAKAPIDESNLWHRMASNTEPLVRPSLSVFFLATKDETSPILKTFITGLENQLSLKVKVIRSDNETEFKNNDLNQLCGIKGIKREFSVPRTLQQNGIAERKNKTLIEAAKTMLADSLLPISFWTEAVNTAYSLGKFDGKVDEGFLVGYSVSSKAFRVLNSRTRIVQETLHVNFLENKPNVEGSDPTWLFDIDSLTKTMNYQPVTAGNQSNHSAGFQDNFDAKKAGEEIDQQYVFFPVWSSGSTNPQNTDGDTAFDEKEYEFGEKKPESEVIVSPSSSSQSRKQDDKTKRESKGKSPVESFTGYKDLSAEFEDCSDNNINEVNAVVPTVRKISPNSTNTFSPVGPSNVVVSPTHGKSSFINASQLLDDPDMPELEDITYFDDEDNVGAEADFNNLETSITVSPIPTTRVHKDHPVTQIIEPKRVHQALKDPSWIEAMQEELIQFKMHKDERGIMVRNKARLVPQGHTQEEGIGYEEVFAPVARIEAIRLFLAYASFIGFMVYQIDVKSAFLYGTIEEEVYVCQPPRKFGLTDEKSASTPIDTEKPLLKDHDGEDVDVHTYRSLVYLTSSRLDIMFAVCVCARFQVTPKASHLHAVKRIFRYLKGKPHLGLWYLKDSPFDLVAYSDSDYAGASLDRKSTTEGCQFLGCRLISWQCKKQIVVATSSTKAKYVVAASCCAQVLWIQNQLLDYGPDQTVSGKVSSNQLMADNLPKIVWYSTHHVTQIKSWLVQKQTTLGKDKPNPLILDSLLKTIWSSIHHLLINEVLTIPGQMTTGVNTPRCDEDMLELIELKIFLLPKVEKVRIGVSVVDLQVSAVRLMLLLEPNIYVSCIKQFWTVVAVKKVNDVIRLQAVVDKKKVVVTEATIREVLRLDDAEGVECRKFNFSKYIFDSLVRNVDSPSKFYMYPRFLQLMIRKQVGDLSTHTTKYTFPALTQKVFTNMRRVDEGDDAEVHSEDVNAGNAAEGDVSAAHVEVPSVVEEPSIPSPTPHTSPPQPSQDIPSTSQAHPTAP
nr:uncharacterized mitochondrial protein AtMg00810-like [Tanacetum cinerariifolium]